MTQVSEMREAAEWLGRDPAELLRVREGTYGAPGQPQVYYEDADTYADVTDLYTVLENARGNGTPNLENAQVEDLATSILSGHALSDVQIGVLQRLLDKYQASIQELRGSPDRDGQDYTSVPDPGTARIVGG